MEGISGILTSGALEQGAFFVFCVILLWVVYLMAKDNKAQVTNISEKYAESMDKTIKTFADTQEKKEERHSTERRELLGYLRDK